MDNFDDYWLEDEEYFSDDDLYDEDWVAEEFYFSDDDDDL
jgi:hypothetical protein